MNLSDTCHPKGGLVGDVMHTIFGSGKECCTTLNQSTACYVFVNHVTLCSAFLYELAFSQVSRINFQSRFLFFSFLFFSFLFFSFLSFPSRVNLLWSLFTMETKFKWRSLDFETQKHTSKTDRIPVSRRDPPVVVSGLSDDVIKRRSTSPSPPPSVVFWRLEKI